MEGDTVVDVASTKSCTDMTATNQPEVSAVPDLVSNVPAKECLSEVPRLDTAAAPVQDLPSTNPRLCGQDSKVPRATSQCSATTEGSARSRHSREEKIRKKDDKSVDHVLRALNSLSTPEEKLAAMCKKYADFFDEHRKLQMLQKQTEKRCSVLQREKEQLQQEHSKAILTRSRLENLCRELQRQNKAIKDESLLKIREEEEKRKEVSAKFQTTMNEITTLMQQNSDKNMKLRDDNIDMSTKLKNICEQYELRQQQVERISKQMQLEQQLSEAKLTKFKLEIAAEKELMLKEKQELLMELQQYKQRCLDFQATELNLRNQISFYNDKYDEFQKSLARSNDVVGGFKGEMERMTKKICKLEKETSTWKQRWERSNNVQLEMSAAKQKSDQEMAVISRQLVTLQGLCRTLQTERSNMLTKIKLLQDNQPESQEKVVNNPINKCNKQCNHTSNHSETSNRIDRPLTNTSENDYVLNRLKDTQDILTSCKESDKPMDVPSNNTVPFSFTECDVKSSSVTSNPDTAVHVPVTPSPMPDVIGGFENVQITEDTPDQNNDLCQRLENKSTNQVFKMQGNSTSSQSNLLATEILPSVNEPVILSLPNQEVLLEDKLCPNIENLHLINGDLKSPPTQDHQNDLCLELTHTLKATENTVESNGCEKKLKEPKKKKK